MKKLHLILLLAVVLLLTCVAVREWGGPFPAPQCDPSGNCIPGR